MASWWAIDNYTLFSTLLGCTPLITIVFNSYGCYATTATSFQASDAAARPLITLLRRMPLPQPAAFPFAAYPVPVASPCRTHYELTSLAPAIMFTSSAAQLAGTPIQHMYMFVYNFITTYVSNGSAQWERPDYGLTYLNHQYLNTRHGLFNTYSTISQM